MTGNAFKAGFLNINLLRGHIEPFRKFFSDNPNYHLFGVAESWLGPSVDDSLVRIDGFSLIRNDRNVSGSGVALYVRSDFRVTRLAFSETTGSDKPGVPEYLFCAVQ